MANSSGPINFVPASEKRIVMSLYGLLQPCQQNIVYAIKRAGEALEELEKDQFTRYNSQE